MNIYTRMGKKKHAGILKIMKTLTVEQKQRILQMDGIKLDFYNTKVEQAYEILDEAKRDAKIKKWKAELKYKLINAMDRLAKLHMLKPMIEPQASANEGDNK